MFNLFNKGPKVRAGKPTQEEKKKPVVGMVGGKSARPANVLGDAWKKLQKMDRKQAYTFGGIAVVALVALISIASMGGQDPEDFNDFETRGYDLANMPFSTDEAEQYLLASKYPDMNDKSHAGLYSKSEKEARQAEDAAEAHGGSGDAAVEDVDGHTFFTAGGHERRPQFCFQQSKDTRTGKTHSAEGGIWLVEGGEAHGHAQEGVAQGQRGQGFFRHVAALPCPCSDENAQGAFFAQGVADSYGEPCFTAGCGLKPDVHRVRGAFSMAGGKVGFEPVGRDEALFPAVCQPSAPFEQRTGQAPQQSVEQEKRARKN